VSPRSSFARGQKKLAQIAVKLVNLATSVVARVNRWFVEHFEERDDIWYG